VYLMEYGIWPLVTFLSTILFKEPMARKSR
jgi:hypothetical protein